MKNLILISTVICFLSFAVKAENKPSANDVLKSTSEALNKLPAISYNCYREINNFKDNYFSKNKGSVYFEFNNQLEGKVSRFQFQSDEVTQVYNGSEYFRLDGKTQTYELQKGEVKELGNLSLLYNSMAILRISLPIIIEDQSIPKSLKDTLIDGKSFHLLKFDLLKKSLAFPSGFNSFDLDLTRNYKLVIDKETYLPYMVFDGNSISKDQYYTKTVFTKINTQPQPPKANSWYYSSYIGYELEKKKSQTPMITLGSLLLDWKLPHYGTTDTIGNAQRKGKIVLMEFWIKNCGYCMEAFPEIKRLQEKFGNQIEILSINAYEKKDEIDFFYKREKPKYKMLYDGEKFANSLGIYAYPATILQDKTGKIVYVSRGFDKGEVEKAIIDILKL
jgi:thiol-disulfide isomerase/thioredoxin